MCRIMVRESEVRLDNGDTGHGEYHMCFMDDALDHVTLTDRSMTGSALRDPINACILLGVDPRKPCVCIIIHLRDSVS